jgi:hypothetical protein
MKPKLYRVGLSNPTWNGQVIWLWGCATGDDLPVLGANPQHAYEGWAKYPFAQTQLSNPYWQWVADHQGVMRLVRIDPALRRAWLRQNAIEKAAKEKARVLSDAELSTPLQPYLASGSTWGTRSPLESNSGH